MRKLTVYLQICGKDLLCGEIRGMSFEDACFSYSPSWLEREGAAALSLSLPLKNDPYDPQRTRSFFSSLLPSGTVRRDLAGLLRCREEDYLSMLSFLGSDCMGGIRILEEDYPLPVPCLEEFDENRLKRLAGGEGKDMASLLVHSSSCLPGDFPCCTMLRQEEKSCWQLPCGERTGTHMVLQSRPYYERGLVNAALCMRAAERLGIRTSGHQLIGKGEDHRILLAVKRSDRAPSAAEVKDNRILKYHQEDMGQALGISPENVIERDYEGHMAAMFRLIRENACRPIPDMLSLWDRIVFNFLIGNLEGNVRSFALTYRSDLAAVSFSPASFLFCSAMYDPLSLRLPFHIDGCYSPDSLSGKSFENMAPECGIGRRMGRKRFDFLAGGLEKALYESAKELKIQGFEDAVQMAGKILEAGGIRNLR